MANACGYPAREHHLGSYFFHFVEKIIELIGCINLDSFANVEQGKRKKSNVLIGTFNKHHSSVIKRKMPPAIPDRWIPYKACGKVIEGTRFICFKVPLRRTIQTGNRSITEIWDIKTLLSTIPNLGAVIDLTNTARYYDPKELEAAGVLHKKILMPGRIIPPQEKVTEFMNACDEFLGKDCDFVIGVHCTHGLNRTGYMVCRYMRDRLGIDAKEAIKRFEIARGYQIERENYLADLLGGKPPPPHLGKSTRIKPINAGDDHEDASNSELKKNSNEKNNGYVTKKKYTFNGESWRDECRKRDDDVDDHNSPGRYVRHPSYSRNSYRDRLANNSGDDKGNSSRISSQKDCSSPDSDRSYDFRYDY